MEEKSAERESMHRVFCVCVCVCVLDGERSRVFANTEVGL